MVLSMDSKRQRRPNVRLGEIGDVSTTFPRGVTQNVKRDFHCEKKGLGYGFITPEESEYNYISGFSQERVSEFDANDLGFSPWFSDDMLHNRENTNPNSVGFVSDFDMLDEIIKPVIEFGSVAQKSAPANKGRRSKRSKRTAFGGYWNSGIIPQTNMKDENEYRRKEVIGFTSNPYLNAYADHKTTATSEEAYEPDTCNPTFNMQSGGNSSEIWKESDNSLTTESFNRYDSLEVCGSDVINVGNWLESLGYGKYACLFERHEVDEDALPLLTLEDLKEMGMVAVGPRRKLYTAIQQLRHSSGDLST